MKKEKIIFLTLFLFLGNFANAKPSWINAPSEYCSKDEICAVGTGERPAKAKSDARTEIMKFFKTQIKSSFRSSESSDDKNGFSSSISNSIWNGTDGILEGVEIKESFDDDDAFYALASFNKDNASKIIKTKIDELDSKMKSLLKQDTKLSIIELKNAFEERKDLNHFYGFLKNSFIPEIISFDDIQQLMNKNIAKNEKFFIELNSSDENRDELVSEIKNVITSTGNFIVLDKSKATRNITGTIKINKEYLNIAGFEKYSVELNLNCLKGKEIISSIIISRSETGRSKEQIINSIMPKLKDDLKKQIYQLI